MQEETRQAESTEDEFTYSPGVRYPTSSPVNTDHESIKLLVQRADELVATPNRVDPFMFQTENQKNKLSRVKEWLNFDSEDKPSDSCDASGECTSGDSEEDHESHSQSSEDLNESVITCRPQVLASSCLNNSNSSATIDVIDVSASSDFVKVNNFFFNVTFQMKKYYFYFGFLLSERVVMVTVVVKMRSRISDYQGSNPGQVK